VTLVLRTALLSLLDTLGFAPRYQVRLGRRIVRDMRRAEDRRRGWR
jgi:hypothetical protein